MIRVFLSKNINRDQRAAKAKGHFDEPLPNLQDEGGLWCVGVGRVDFLTSLFEDIFGGEKKNGVWVR